MTRSSVLLPDELQLQILRFVQAAPHPHLAFCALVGAAAGACSPVLSRRELAEALWRLGDHTVESAAL